MIWQPTQDQIERTNVWRFMRRLGFNDREAFLRFSVAAQERFWDEVVREMGIEWFRPYDRVLDLSRGPEWAEWFLGGRLNIAHNCLDRYAASGRLACIWEGESGAVRSITFAELRKEANRVANGLLALGLAPGDRVAVCLPMAPEILAILYGCFKLGLTVVPIFAGFSAGAIATRLADSGARVVAVLCYLASAQDRLADAGLPETFGDTPARCRARGSRTEPRNPVADRFLAHPYRRPVFADGREVRDDNALHGFRLALSHREHLLSRECMNIARQANQTDARSRRPGNCVRACRSAGRE